MPQIEEFTDPIKKTENRHAPGTKWSEWTKQEDDHLKEHAQEGAQALNERMPWRSPAAIAHRAKHLSVPLGNINRWTDEEDTIIKQNPDKTIKTLETLLPGRSNRAIAGRRATLKKAEQKAGYIYVLTHLQEKTITVNITKDPEARLKEIRKAKKDDGWEIPFSRRFKAPLIARRQLKYRLNMAQHKTEKPLSEVIETIKTLENIA